VLILAANKLLLTCTLLFGINTSPVPLARNSKLLLDNVVVIKLSSIRTSSNCACELISNVPVISKSLVTVKLPSCVFPSSATSPLIVRKPWYVSVPPTVRLF